MCTWTNYSEVKVRTNQDHSRSLQNEREKCTMNIEFINNKALCDFPHFPKTGNYVVTWRGVKISNGNFNLLEVGEFWPDIPKISLRNSPVCSINSVHTNIYIYNSCILIV